MENTRVEIYKDNFAEYLLCLSLDIGEGMLKNGGEVSRVEDTIERICRAYGAVHVEVFSTISVIHAFIRLEDGSFSSQMRRVKQMKMNLGMLERLNALSREVCQTKIPLSEFEDKLKAAKGETTYPAWLISLANAVACCGFTFFFGGTWRDGLVSFVIGLLLSLLDYLPQKHINSMAKTAISSFIIAIGAALAVKWGIADNSDIMVIGSIMILVPGLFFGTAMRDMLTGDLSTGSLKTLQAVIEALMLAFGYMLAVTVMGGVAI